MALPAPFSTPETGDSAHAAGERRGRALSALLVALIAAVMLSTVLDYGMTGDEGVQHRYARRVLHWYATLGADRSAVAEEDISMYGALFEGLAEAAASVSPLDPYETRHVVNVLFALAAFVAVLRMGRHLGGTLGGVLAVLLLALTPPFYGHAFNNPKDIPFAATFAVAVCMILVVSDRSPRLRRRDILAAAMAIGMAAGVRVAGIVLFGFALLLWAGVALIRSRAGVATEAGHWRDLRRLALAWLVVVVIGWAVMVVLWPWAQVAPLRNPLRALGAFSRFWETMVVFYDGQYVLNGTVSRFYIPRWFALTMPETYLIAAALGVLQLGRRWRRPAWPLEMRVKLLQAGWLVLVATLPVTWVVARHTPLYDGLRHFLFVVPLLAVATGASAASYLRACRGRTEGTIAGLALAGLGALTLSDMIALHPYEAIYFNRLVAGGLRRAVERYDTDYWCLTYKEGTEWLLARYAKATCPERIRVGGHSILLQTSYYLKKTEEGRRLFTPVSLDDDPNFAMATTRFGDHRHTPGRLVHTVDRQGATLLHVFEVKPPLCAPPP
ncbi:MAG TPA: hypothetical protein VIK51_15895 [Vicinamibacteria bacterium]|jgi:hypothetical protein